MIAAARNGRHRIDKVSLLVVGEAANNALRPEIDMSPFKRPGQG